MVIKVMQSALYYITLFFGFAGLIVPNIRKKSTIVLMSLPLLLIGIFDFILVPQILPILLKPIHFLLWELFMLFQGGTENLKRDENATSNKIFVNVNSEFLLFCSLELFIDLPPVSVRLNSQILI